MKSAACSRSSPSRTPRRTRPGGEIALVRSLEQACQPVGGEDGHYLHVAAFAFLDKIEQPGASKGSMLTDLIFNRGDRKARAASGFGAPGLTLGLLRGVGAPAMHMLLKNSQNVVGSARYTSDFVERSQQGREAEAILVASTARGGDGFRTRGAKIRCSNATGLDRRDTIGYVEGQHWGPLARLNRTVS